MYVVGSEQPTFSVCLNLSLSGIDFGGVCTAKKMNDFVDVFTRARGAGLHMAMHCGEDPNDQKEVKEMLSFRPDRLGHCPFLDKDNMEALVQSGIPVETCITCHKLAFAVEFKHNIYSRLPHSQLTLATDNPAFYGTTLSQEFMILCTHHDLTLVDLLSLARQGIEFAFVSSEVKDSLRSQFDQSVNNLIVEFNL